MTSATVPDTSSGAPARSRRGEVAYHAGLAAEEQVAAHYLRRGHALAARRWRGSGGEIDLVMRKGRDIVFVEVKKAGSLHDAAFRLAPRQVQRLQEAGAEFLATEPLGLNTPARLDLALVGGRGEIEIVENISMA